MINYVKINGVNSNTINGLGINELPPITKPPLRVLQEEIDGRDGDITTDLGYGAYDKTITIGLFGTGYDINTIISFFNGEGTIVFSNEPDKYYKYKIVNQIDYIALQKFKSASITFHCQPFKYPTEETPLEIEYEYIEQSNVEIANINQTETAPMKIDLKGNTSQTGTPTPDTPIPVNVVSGDNEVVVCRKNLFNKNNIVSGKLINPDTSGTEALNENYGCSEYIPVKANTSYVRQYNNNFYGAFYDNNKTFVSAVQNQAVITPSQDGYVRISFQLIYIDKVQLEVGTSPTTYEPYQSQTYPIYLGVENLYEGSQDFSGEWQYLSSWETASETFNGCVVKKRAGSWNGTYKVFSIKAGETYTYSVYAKSDEARTGGLYIDSGVTPAALNINLTTEWQRYSITFTANADDNNVRPRIENTTNSSTNYTYIACYQLEKGSKLNSYTPYGTPPIEMCKIGDYQDYFTKNSGKNLLSLTNQDFSIGDLHYSVDNGVLQATGSRSAEVQKTNNSFRNNFKMTLSAGTYKVNFSESGTKTGTLNYYIMKYSDNSEIKRIQTTYDTFTLNEETEIYLGIYSYQLAITGTLDIRIMLCKDDGTTPIFEPYGTGLWCKYNAIGKVVLDGSEMGWNLFFSTAGVFVLSNYIQSKTSGDDIQCISDYFTATYRTNIRNNLETVDDVCATNGGEIILANKDFSILSDFITWLSSHNTTLYTILATPYLSLIEDTTLINQLDNIQNAMSYKGTTNIMQVNNDKSFLMDLKIMKEGTNAVVINNIGNYYAKPTIALEGTGITDIYLNDTEILQVDLSDTNKITIDTANMEAYDPTTNLLANRKVVGSYNSMTLPSGNTTMKITGQLTSATITDYTRYL